MAYSAQLTVIADFRGWAAQRRVVNFTAHARSTRSEIAEVTVTELSTTGCKLSCERPLAPDTEIWLKISGTGARRARIVSAEQEQLSCEFQSPMDRQTVEQLAAGAYETMKKKRSVKPLF